MSDAPRPDPVFFASPAEFRAWLERHHHTARELSVGYHRKGTGRPTLTWQESVAEALCFGWIDGVRRSVDAERYTIRFTPRRRGSHWSAVNLRLAEELIRDGRMHPAGLRAYEQRDPARSGAYSFEQREAVELGPDAEALLRANPAAWSYFSAQPPGYRRTATWWVVSAKREETRARRLRMLIEDSAAGRRIAPLRPAGG